LQSKRQRFSYQGVSFFKDEIVNISIGSSNLTQNAISTNKEWNTSFSSSDKGELFKHIINDFQSLWDSEFSHAISDETLDEYATLYKESKRLEREKQKVLQESSIVSIEQIKLVPNTMQVAFIKRLNELRLAGADKALLISATGTGKTYAAAFALRDINPKRALFLVHRETILRQARKSFKNVFGTTKSMGIYSGNSSNKEEEKRKDLVFATMQTMALHYGEFDPKTFDVIVIDEAHRSGAESYQRMMKYFTPNLWLGMTASPDRTDGFDVYKAFDYNIAYEIRLQEAMRLNLLCPFHYYGITEFLLNDEEKDYKDFANLVRDDRVEYIIEKANYFGHSGNRLKGLVFCSNIKEAQELSNKFNQRGFRTLPLFGNSSPDDREKAIQKLETEDYDNGLDYIFTVDIFNEGVDIPQVNQVIMLRPTESPIVFIQQLGRGLRHASEKEYVMILDFIGNYNNNYMIPIALSGDKTYNKDNIRRYLREGCKVLDGASSIHFDEIAREKIFRSIDSISNLPAIIKSSYQNLKFRLGRIPNLVDFFEYGEVDPMLILDKYENYPEFLRVVEKEGYQSNLSEQDLNFLSYLSVIIAKGLDTNKHSVLQNILDNGYSTRKISTNELQILQGSFLRKSFKLKDSEEPDVKKNLAYKFNNVCMVESVDGKVIPNEAFLQSLAKSSFKQCVQDILALSKRRHDTIYTKMLIDENPFILYEKYSRQDISLLLDAEKDLSSTMYGKWRQNDHVCIFVTYHKAEAGEEKEYIDGKPDYADEFVDNETFRWDTQIGQDENSPYMDSVESATFKHLFVKKSDGEGTDFYYMGTFSVTAKRHATKKDNRGKERPIAKVSFKMDTPVKSDIFNYLKAN